MPDYENEQVRQIQELKQPEQSEAVKHESDNGGGGFSLPNIYLGTRRSIQLFPVKQCDGTIDPPEIKVEIKCPIL